jgi:hypothetical protein
MPVPIPVPPPVAAPPPVAVNGTDGWSPASLITSGSALAPLVRIDRDESDEDVAGASEQPPAVETAPTAPPTVAPTLPEPHRAAWLAADLLEDGSARPSAPLLPPPEPPPIAPEYPIPPAFGDPPDASAATAVPTWSFRAPSPSPQPARAPAFVSDLALDPLSLRPRARIRSGARTLTVDESGLVVRTLWQRRVLAWTEVLGFETRVDGSESRRRSGRLVALTRRGPLELPATKRPIADLHRLHALLDAHRQRAQLMRRKA